MEKDQEEKKGIVSGKKLKRLKPLSLSMLARDFDRLKTMEVHRLGGNDCHRPTCDAGTITAYPYLALKE